MERQSSLHKASLLFLPNLRYFSKPLVKKRANNNAQKAFTGAFIVRSRGISHRPKNRRLRAQAHEIPDKRLHLFTKRVQQLRTLQSMKLQRAAHSTHHSYTARTLYTRGIFTAKYIYVWTGATLKISARCP